MTFGFRAILVASIALLVAACEPPVQKATLASGAEKVSGFEVVYLSRLPTPVNWHSTSGPLSPLDMDKMMSEASGAFETQIKSGFRPLLEKDGLYRRVSVVPAREPFSSQPLSSQILQLSFTEPSALVVVPLASSIYCGGFLARACRVDMTLQAALVDTRQKRVQWTQRQVVIATPAYGGRGDVLGDYWAVVGKLLRDDRLID
jgi:hypothetical protein